MSEQDNPPKTPERVREYETPAIEWEEELPQGASIFSACGKIGGAGGPCNASAAS